MKRYDLLIVALYGVILVTLFVGGILNFMEKQGDYNYMLDWRKKKVNVVMIEDTQLHFKVEKVTTPLRGDFKLMGRLNVNNVRAIRIENDTLFIEKRATKYLEGLQVASHVQVDLLNESNISITLKP